MSLQSIHWEDEVIRLQPVTAEDVPFMCALYGDARNMRYLRHRTDPDELLQAVQVIIDRTTNPDQPDVSFVVIDQRSGTKLAITGIVWPEAAADAVEIGIVVAHQWHRRGYGHRAKLAVMDIAFRHFQVNTVNAFCGLENQPANQANLKLGFRLAGQAHHGDLDTTVNHWTISKEEFLCQNKKAV